MTKVTLTVELSFTDDVKAGAFYAEATGPNKNGVAFSQDFANAVTDPNVGFQVIDTPTLRGSA